MKVCDEVKNIKAGFNISTHSLFKKIADAVAKKVFIDTNITLSLSNKTVNSDGKIEAVLTGFVDGDVSTESEVHKSLSEIKSPSELMNLLE